jgi:hypothetical protein
MCDVHLTVEQHSEILGKPLLPLQRRPLHSVACGHLITAVIVPAASAAPGKPKPYRSAISFIMCIRHIGSICNVVSGDLAIEIAATSVSSLPVVASGSRPGVDDESLLFHTVRQLFPMIKETVSSVISVERFRHIGLSHFESHEGGGLNALLDVALSAVLQRDCGDDLHRPLGGHSPGALADGEMFSTDRHTFRWFCTPHVPHSWNGLLLETTTNTCFGGDCLLRKGRGRTRTHQGDILEPSEVFRRPLDYFGHAPQTHATLDRRAEERPTTLACMHGSVRTETVVDDCCGSWGRALR